jgi:hypothetical protein
MQLMSQIADIVGILGALFALLAWLQTRAINAAMVKEQQRQNKQVTVVLQHGAEKATLPVSIRRAELTRSEILGRLGMIPLVAPDPSNRFSLRYLNTPEFLQSVNQVAAGDGDAILTIPCNEQEFRQFALN